MGQGFDADRALALGGGVHDHPGAVGAAVVDQDQLVSSVPGVEIALDLLDRARQALLLVVARDDDAERRTFGHGSPS